MVQYSLVQFSLVQYSIVQYSIVWYRKLAVQRLATQSGPQQPLLIVSLPTDKELEILHYLTTAKIQQNRCDACTALSRSRIHCHGDFITIFWKSITMTILVQNRIYRIIVYIYIQYIIQYSILQYSIAQHSIAQHSTAQHSIAQQSIAQHRIAQGL